MKLILTVDGTDETLDYGLDCFTRYHGWTEESGDKEAYAEATLKRYLKDSIRCFVAQQAQASAALAATTQVDAVLGTAKTTLKKEP